MTRNKKIMLRRAFLVGVIGLNSCSMTALKQYPETPLSLFQNVASEKGISAVAKLISVEESKEYFGMNLFDNEIYPVHLTIRNDNAEVSYIVSVEQVQINQQEGEYIITKPAHKIETAGEIVSIISIASLSILASLPAAKLLSDASIINENFELKKLRRSTIDPGEKIAGFSYLKLYSKEVVENLRICLSIFDPIKNLTFPYCLDIAVKK